MYNRGVVLMFGYNNKKTNKDLTNDEELSILKQTRDRISVLQEEGKSEKEILKALKQENKLGILAK